MFFHSEHFWLTVWLQLVMSAIILSAPRSGASLYMIQHTDAFIKVLVWKVFRAFMMPNCLLRVKSVKLVQVGKNPLIHIRK